MNEIFAYIKKIFSQITSLILADSVSLILMTFFSILFGRMFGEEIFGIFSLSFILLAVFRTIIDIGFDYSLPRAISASTGKNINEIYEAQIIKQYIFIALIPVSIIISFFSTLSFIFIILYISLFPSSLAMTFKAALRGLSEMKTIAKVDTITNVSFYSIAAIIVLLKLEIWIIFSLFVISEYIRAFWYSKKINAIIEDKINFRIILFTPMLEYKKKVFNTTSNFRVIKIVARQLKLLSINLLSVLHFRLSSLLLGIMGSVASVGDFTAAMRFLTAMRVIPGAILNTLLPDFSKPTNNKKGSKAYVILFLFLIGLIISFILWLFASPLIMFTFGFESSIPVLKILSWSFVLAILSFSCEAYLISKRKEKYANYSLLIALIITTIISIIYIPKYAAVGAAIAALVAEAVLLLSYLFFIAQIKLLNLKNAKKIV